MDRAEIVEGLQQIRQQPCFSDMRYVSLGLLDAAIALIEPQPVTEAGLREAGFTLDEYGYWRMDMAQHGPRKLLSYKLGRGAFFLLGWDSIDLHITDMQHLHAVIAALRATP